MKQLNDRTLLQSYLEQYQIASLFETEHLNFRLYEYERSEVLNFIKDSTQYLQFFVKGEAQIYSVRHDGSRYPLCYVEPLTLLGDMEFCGEHTLPFLVEATKKVHCVELNLSECRRELLNDNTFLRYLLHSIARKTALTIRFDASFATLEERFLYYLEHDCANHTMHSVEVAATHLHCSRRQLQRILKQLQEKNQIEKCGKGIYRLTTSFSLLLPGIHPAEVIEIIHDFPDTPDQCIECARLVQINQNHSDWDCKDHTDHAAHAVTDEHE